jgi:hypothetical protein
MSDILRRLRVESYYRYVDDMLILYNKHDDIAEVQKSFNDVTAGLNFTLEWEEDNKLNFLDLIITKREN